jgi:hypothetical protein
MALFEELSVAPEAAELAVENLHYYSTELPLRRLRAILKEREGAWTARKFQLIGRSKGYSHMGLAAYTFAQGLRKFHSQLHALPISDIDPFQLRRSAHNALSFIALADLYDKTLWTPDKPDELGGIMEVKEEGANKVGGIECHLHVDPAVGKKYFGHDITRDRPYSWYADETLFVRREPSVSEPHAAMGLERLKTAQTLDTLDMLSPYVRFTGSVPDIT